MEFTEIHYELKLNRRELCALQKALYELDTLKQKYPDERNGFDLMSQGIVSQIRETIDKYFLGALTLP